MQLDLLLSILGMFAAVAVVSGVVISTLLERATPEHRRLRAVTAAPGSSTAGVLLDNVQLQETPDPFLARLSNALPKSPREMSGLRRRLAMAGYYDLRTAVVYSAAELVCPVLLGALPIMILGLGDGWVFGILGAILGYLAPGVWLMRRTSARQRSLHNGLPDALDLFIVCMEAGSSLDQAILKTSDELEISHPALSYELRLITTEIRAGKPRIQAFKNFANRTGVDDVRSLVSMLIQTDRFGTSVAQALRIHASTSRTKRRQLAEERAGKIGVKLVFPLVLCLFPAVYIVCMGPVVIRIYRAFF